jgi:hypothetical protein
MHCGDMWLTSTEFFLASALLELAHLAADPSRMIFVAYYKLNPRNTCGAYLLS